MRSDSLYQFATRHVLGLETGDQFFQLVNRYRYDFEAYNTANTPTSTDSYSVSPGTFGSLDNPNYLVEALLRYDYDPHHPNNTAFSSTTSDSNSSSLSPFSSLDNPSYSAPTLPPVPREEPPASNSSCSYPTVTENDGWLVTNYEDQPLDQDKPTNFPSEAYNTAFSSTTSDSNNSSLSPFSSLDNPSYSAPTLPPVPREEPPASNSSCSYPTVAENDGWPVTNQEDQPLDQDKHFPTNDLRNYNTAICTSDSDSTSLSDNLSYHPEMLPTVPREEIPLDYSPLSYPALTENDGKPVTNYGNQPSDQDKQNDFPGCGESAPS